MAPIRTAAVFPIALPGGAQERVGALSLSVETESVGRELRFDRLITVAL
jgi:hypothetical protein